MLCGGAVLLYRILLSSCGEDISSEEVLAKCPLQQHVGTLEWPAQLITWPVQAVDQRWEKALCESRTEHSLLVWPCAFHHGDRIMVWQVVVIYGDAQRCQRSAKFPCKLVVRKRRGFIRDTSVCLTFNLSKGGKDSRMHGLCRGAVRQPSASSSFSHPPQIALQHMNASAHPRAFWCENEVRWSMLVLGAGENGCTIDQQKQPVSVNPALNPAVTIPADSLSSALPSQRRKFLLSRSFIKELSAVLFGARWCDWTYEGVQAPSSLSSEDQLGSFKLSSKKTLGLMLREGQIGSR